MAEFLKAKSTHTILMSCAGLGMGNASRLVAVIEALFDHCRKSGNGELDLHVVSWGSGLRFLEEYRRDAAGTNFQLIEARPYEKQSFGLLGYLPAFLKNVIQLSGIVRRLQPDLIVLDSDYHFPAYFGSACPVVFIGQAEDVLLRSRAHDYLPKFSEKLNLIFREKLDSWVQKIFSDVVLVPSFNEAGAADSKVRRIPLIVRREFLEKPRSVKNQTVGLLLSGSKQEKENFLTVANEHGLRILAPDVNSNEDLAICKAADLDEFDIVFIQGGLSSISECIARQKFAVVFPLKGHAEQHLNAREVEKLGLGMKSNLDELKQFSELLQRATARRLRSALPAIPCNGAQAAAEILLEKLR
jgi:hypothetical protein